MGIVGLMKYPFGVEELPALLRRQSRGSDGNSGVMWSRSLGRVRGALGYPWVWQSRSKLGVSQVGSPCHRRHVACRCASPALSLGGKDKLAGETAGRKEPSVSLQGVFCCPRKAYAGECPECPVHWFPPARNPHLPHCGVLYF